jgi:hypothetical protein
MIPGVYNLDRHYNGDLFQWPVFQLFVDDTTEKDITNTRIDLWVRRSNARGAIVLKLSTDGNTITKVDTANGKFKPAEVDVDWGGGKYVYDIQLTEGTAVQTVQRGDWLIEEDITK